MCPSRDFQETFNCFYSLPQDGPTNKVAELMVPVETLLGKTFQNSNLQKTESKKSRSYGKLRRSCDAQFFLSNSLQNSEILNNTCSTAQNLSGRLCKPAQLELYPSATTSRNNGSTCLPICSFSLGTPTWVFLSHCTDFTRFHLEDHLNGSD